MVKKIPVFMVGDRIANYFPLSIGLMKACLQHLGGPDFQKHFQLMGVLNQSASDTVRVAGAFGPGIWLFSNYLWNQEENLRLSAAIKSLHPHNLTIHGGPSLPKYPDAYQELWSRHGHIDVGIRGEGEFALLDLFRHLLKAKVWHTLEADKLQEVAGLTFRTPEGLFRTAERPRIENLDLLPSPYLEGVFDRLEGSAWTVESNRGCPYGCVFCDWGSLTAQKIKKFDLERVKQELEWGAKRSLPTLFLSDANFGIFERDLEIAEHIVELRSRYGYPVDVNVAFAKNAKKRVADIVKLLHRGGLYVDPTLALQSTDPTTLQAIGRSNISTEGYESLMGLFKEEGVRPSSDLMVRLPGQTYQAFKADLQKFLDQDVPVLIHPTLMLPNSPMASPLYRQEWEILTDSEGRVVSCRSFTLEEGQKMLALRNAYFFTEFYSFFRYVMRYLQWDHGILGTDFLEALVEDYPWFSGALKAESQPYDFTSHHAFRDLLHTIHKREFPLYQESLDWVCKRFSLEADSSLETVFAFNESIIPDCHASYPKSVHLAHDMPAYFHARDKKLSRYPSRALEVREREAGQATKLPYRRSARDWVWELDWSS